MCVEAIWSVHSSHSTVHFCFSWSSAVCVCDSHSLVLPYLVRRRWEKLHWMRCMRRRGCTLTAVSIATLPVDVVFFCVRLCFATADALVHVSIKKSQTLLISFQFRVMFLSFVDIVVYYIWIWRVCKSGDNVRMFKLVANVNAINWFARVRLLCTNVCTVNIVECQTRRTHAKLLCKLLTNLRAHVCVTSLEKNSFRMLCSVGAFKLLTWSLCAHVFIL